MKYKILHTADIQVNIREKNLRRSFEKCLENIYNVVKNEKIAIYTIVGDLFEYALANEAETKIMYYHLSKIITLETVKELVIMAGNHDLVKEKHVSANQEDENKINTFFHTLSALNTEHAHKITYLKFSNTYLSKASNKLIYVPYSLEDDMVMREKNFGDIASEHPDCYMVSFFHDIVKDYAVQTKLPIQKQKMDSLVSCDEFNTRFILAGDIHVFWDCIGEAGQQFLYPGSPIQRNFGEGEYVKIGQQTLDIKGDTKKVRVFQFDDEKLLFTQETPIELPDYVSYVTFEIMKDIPFDVAYKGISEILDSVTFGEEQTFIKLKLSNLFLSHEMDFHKLITTKTSHHNRVQLEISYDKFVNTQMQTNINKILGETSDSDEQQSTDTSQLTTNEEAATIDSLILDSNRLRKLFLYVLDSRMEKIIKEFPNDASFIEKVYSSTVELFDSQLNDCLSVMKKVNIQFESIECNGFMILGSNKINLKVPGITRISGTNGVGKTTLYNMMRWVIRNEIYEGMPKNRVKQNTMGVFNNKNAELDTVMVRLVQMVNNTQVVATRIATRTWKRNVTDEQKISLNWQDYIQSISNELTVEFEGKNGPRQFVGDQAQNYLDSWFGKTPETILFLNYTKILSILNTSPKELNETVLDFIGVDYLKTLGQNVEAVKMELMVEKPKRSKEVVLDDIKINGEKLKENKLILDNAKNQGKLIDKSIEGFENSLKEENNKLISLGDIPDKISTHKSKINELRVEIDEFVEKPHLVSVEFNEPKPEKYDQTEDNTKLDSVSKLIVSVQTDIDRCNEDKNLTVKKLKELYEKVIEVLDQQKTTSEDERNKLVSSVGVLKSEIDSLNIKISSSICPECKRPYDSLEEYEANKIIWENKIKELQSQSAEQLININKLVDRVLKIKEATTITREKLSKINQGNFDFIENNNVCKPVFDQCILINNEIETLLKKKSEYNTKSEDILKKISDAKTKYIEDYSAWDEARQLADNENKKIDTANAEIDKHNDSIKTNKLELKLMEDALVNIEKLKPEYDKLISARLEIELSIEADNKKKVELQNSINNASVEVSRLTNNGDNLLKEVGNIYRYVTNNTIFKLYNTLIKDDFKGIVFEYYRNFLNNELNNLLEDVNFKLFWNADNELFMVKMEDGVCSYTPVQQTSGMEVVFLGLSLIYTMSILNIRNSISTIFIDELSGQLNKGDQLGYKARNYQELFVSILSKFTNKQVVIVDHNIRNLYETVNYEVVPSENGSIYIAK